MDPASCINLTIASGAGLQIGTTGSLTVSGTLTNNAGTAGLVVLSDATGTGSLIENSGVNATIERYYTGGQWHFISSPVSDAYSGMYSGLYLQSFDETTNIYTDITSTTELLNPMQGYALWNDNTATASYTGTLNTNSIGNDNNLTRSIAGDNGGNNLVGNPYPSSIDWDASSGWTKTNTMGAIYVEDAGNWGIYVTGSGSAGTGNLSNYIAPGQGFFVFVNDDGSLTGTLKMDNNVRVHSNAPFLKSTYSNYLKLVATGNEKSDATVIHFMDETTGLFDSQYDARKLFATDNSYPQIYSIMDKDLAINALPETDWVQLGFKAGISGLYTISASELNDIANVWLEDTFTNEYTNLSTDSYTFNYSVGESETRFVIHFTPLAVPENAENISGIYSYGNEVFVTVKDKTKGTILIYNLMGQEVSTTPISGSSNVLTIDKSGYYVIEVVTSESVISKKVFIK